MSGVGLTCSQRCSARLSPTRAKGLPAKMPCCLPAPDITVNFPEHTYIP